MAQRGLLASLKQENKLLRNTKKNHDDALAQFHDNIESQHDAKYYTEQVIKLKEKFKLAKEELKSSNEKVKRQNQLTYELDSKLHKMKEFLEKLKKKQEEESSERASEDYISELQGKIAALEKEQEIEENNYKELVARSKNMTQSVMDEIRILTLSLKEKEQEIRINHLKLKELQKIKRNKLKPMENKRSTSAQGMPRKAPARQREVSIERRVKPAKPSDLNNLADIRRRVNSEISHLPAKNKEKESAIKESLAEIENLKRNIQEFKRDLVIF